MIGLICWKGTTLVNSFLQGDIIKIEGKNHLFLIVSNNTFIKYTGAFHICPIIENVENNPLHIAVRTAKGYAGTAICEQLLLFDPSKRPCSKYDDISYDQIMNISDAIQGVFEYD